MTSRHSSPQKPRMPKTRHPIPEPARPYGSSNSLPHTNLPSPARYLAVPCGTRSPSARNPFESHFKPFSPHPIPSACAHGTRAFPRCPGTPCGQGLERGGQGRSEPRPSPHRLCVARTSRQRLAACLTPVRSRGVLQHTLPRTGRGGIRTRTSVFGQEILSLQRLPFRHSPAVPLYRRKLLGPT